MDTSPIIISFPIEDRRRAFDFYTAGLSLTPLGEPADNGVPEPLQFRLNAGVGSSSFPQEDSARSLETAPSRRAAAPQNAPA